MPRSPLFPAVLVAAALALSTVPAAEATPKVTTKKSSTTTSTTTAGTTATEPQVRTCPLRFGVGPPAGPGPPRSWPRSPP